MWPRSGRGGEGLSATAPVVEALEGRRLLSAGSAAVPPAMMEAALPPAESAAPRDSERASAATDRIDRIFVWTARSRVVGRGRVEEVVRVRAKTPGGMTIRAVAGLPFTGVVAASAFRGNVPVEIYWGDGINSHSEAVVEATADGFRFVGTHTYSEPGRYRIAVHITEQPPPGSRRPVTGRLILSTALVSPPRSR